MLKSCIHRSDDLLVLEFVVLDVCLFPFFGTHILSPLYLGYNVIVEAHILDRVATNVHLFHAMKDLSILG